MTLTTHPNDATSVGAMLFARNVSGVRVISGTDRKSVAGIWFDGFGAHTDKYPFSPYLTAAAAVGMTKHEVDIFVERIEKVLSSLRPNNTTSPSISEGQEVTPV
jgi:O-phospho-L-seryl-tRNASec:L-selenocysteinyl-tRNA synthase